MSESHDTLVLSPSERRLIEAIRALPESDLRERAHEVLGELLFFVQNPRCQGIGAEGFPCGEPTTSCGECHQIWDLLEGIAGRLEQAGKN
jgi:hypothetical protein